MYSRCPPCFQNAEKHRGIAAHFGVVAQETVDVIQDSRGVCADRHAGKRALEHGGHHRRAKPFTGYIGDAETRCDPHHREDVEIIAAHCEAREC